MIHKRLLKISKNRLYYTPTDYIELSASNFPVGTFFSEHKDIFWEVDLIYFDKKNKSLQLKVLDYFPEDLSAFDQQTAKGIFSKIAFKGLDYQVLCTFLSAYSPMKLRPLIQPGSDAIDYQSPFLKSQNKNKAIFFAPPPLKIWEDRGVEDSFIHIEEFKYFFKDASFKLGFVEIKKSFSYLLTEENITFKIYNSDILPEYDYIKTFFPKVFHDRKQFSVKVELEIQGSDLLHYTIRSPEISAINEHLIDSIKQLRTLQIPKISISNPIDKSLFTADEVFENAIDKGLDHNVFQQTETDILLQLLESNDVRNQKQLQYLAGLKQSTRQKLRFTLSPIFGFLFFIEGKKMYHFCWELLNSNATYLWSFDKLDDIKISLRRVEESINVIRDMGRKKYKQAYHQNTLDSDLFFSVIHHKHANSNFKDGFVYWKHRFKECMV